jgi:O-acetylhomoserine (thiol)-lyase
MDKNKLKFDTLQVHAGQEADPATGSRAVPIYQTSSFVFKDTAEAEARFDMSSPGDIYSRISNPTVAVFERRMAALEGGSAALGVASGSAAVAYAVMNVADSGDEIIAASTLYGGTYHLFAHTLPRYGIHTRFVDPDLPLNFEKAITAKSKAIFIETLGNPGINIIDMDALASIAQKHRLPLIVDNTFATPYLFRPLEHGANVVVHSATKFICGHGTSIGGVIVDGGNFDWHNDKFPGFTSTDPGFHGKPYAELEDTAYISKIRSELLRDIGAALSPFHAWLFLQGLETLSLRVQRHVSNTEAIAAWLSAHPKVQNVSYPSLSQSPYYQLKQRYLPRGAGSIFSFSLKAELHAVRTFIDNLQLFSLLANVADAKSLVIHPATTTHQQLSPEARRAAGAGPETIRLSVGLEDPDDLIADIEQALNKI